MSKTSVAAGLAGAFLTTLFGAEGASAQAMWQPGSEIAGHSVQVESNGVVNTVYFDRAGTARIVSPSGREVMGRWTAAGQQLCLETGPTARECWPYRAAFQTGQPVTLTSSCATTSQWTPLSTEPMAPPPRMERRGERG
jgi:hypothetical protein